MGHSSQCPISLWLHSSPFLSDFRLVWHSIKQKRDWSTNCVALMHESEEVPPSNSNKEASGFKKRGCYYQSGKQCLHCDTACLASHVSCIHRDSFDPHCWWLRVRRLVFTSAFECFQSCHWWNYIKAKQHVQLWEKTVEFLVAQNCCETNSLNGACSREMEMDLSPEETEAFFKKGKRCIAAVLLQFCTTFHLAVVHSLANCILSILIEQGVGNVLGANHPSLANQQEAFSNFDQVWHLFSFALLLWALHYLGTSLRSHATPSLTFWCNT